MKKADCLAMHPLTVTKAMRDAALNDRGEVVQMPTYYDSKRTVLNYQYSVFYRAMLGNGLLKVAVWTREAVITRQEKPDYEIYISKKQNEEKWKVYVPSTKSWRTARVDNLEGLGRKGDYYGVKIWDNKAGRELVNTYLGNENKEINIRKAILQFQLGIRKDMMERKSRAELEMIDSIMYQVPQLPKDFEEWAFKDAFTGNHYMLYSTKEQKAHCTYCEQDVPFEKIKSPAHNEEGKCPLCKRQITYKSWNKQNTLKDTKQTGIIQRMKDGESYIARYFHTQIIMRREKGYEKKKSIHEILRIQLSKGEFYEIDAFEWGEYKNTGKRRWIREVIRGYYYGRVTYRRALVIYPRNITRLFQDTELKYIPIKKYLDYRMGDEVSIREINMMKQRPECEMWIKMGLLKYTSDILRDGYTKSKLTGKPWERLEVTKQGMEQMIRLDGGRAELSVIRSAEKYNVKLTDEQVIWYAKHLGSGYAEKLLQYGMPQKFINYFESVLWKDAKDGRDRGGAVRDYADFLEDCRKLRLNLKKSQFFPKNFQQVHDEIAQERREYENKIEQADIRKKNRILKKLLPELRELYSGEDERFIVVFPQKKTDFQIEGRQQHNCVGGSYFDKMIRGDCCVIFLRKKEDPDKSFCTVEFSAEGEVLQNRIANNAEAPKDAQKFINEISKKAMKKIAKKKKEELKKLLEAAG